MCSAFLREVNAVYSISATSASPDPPLVFFFPDRLRVLDPYPRRLGDAADRRGDRRIVAGRDGDARIAPAGRGHDRVLVVGAVGAHRDRPGGPGPAGGGQAVTDQARPAVGRGHIAPPQPGADDHRGRHRCRERRDLRIQALDLGVPVGRTLLGVAVGAADRVVDIEVGHLIGTGQDRRVPGEAGQEPGGHRVQLPHMPERVGPQVRTQRGRRPHPGEQPGHATVAQQSHVLDAVRARDHPGHQGRDLHMHVRSRRPGHAQVLGGQVGQASPLGQRHRRYQATGRHEVRVIKFSLNLMADSHYRVLL